MSTPVPGSIVPSTPALRPQQSDSDRQALTEAKETLKEIQEEFTTYRQQKAENEKCVYNNKVMIIFAF